MDPPYKRSPPREEDVGQVVNPCQKVMRKVRAMADNPVSKVCAIVDYLFANECENAKMAREERENASSNKNADITRIPGSPAGAFSQSPPSK